MRYESNSGVEVLKNLFRRRSLMDRGDANVQDYRPILFVGPGLSRGADGGGRGRAMEKEGLLKVFTHFVGSSTGAAKLLFALSGQICEHLNIYWVEVASKKFFSPRRILFGMPGEDTDYICGVFRNKQDHAAAEASPAEFYVGVTSAVTGEGSFLNAKKVLPDMITAVQASISIPGLSRPVVIDGHPYIDGVGGMAMPIREIVKQFHPTDLLIFANRPEIEKNNGRQVWIDRLIRWKYPRAVKVAFDTVEEQVTSELEYLRSLTDIRWMIFWSDEGLDSLEFNPSKLEKAADEAEAHFASLLEQAKAELEKENRPRAA